MERVPRTVVAINMPIDDSDMATTASATSTSIKVKPAVARLGWTERDNFDPPGQPIDANFVAESRSRQRDDSAAGHAGREEMDRGSRWVFIATRR